MSEPTDSLQLGQPDGVAEMRFNPEDQGVFGVGSERVWRFLAKRYIDEAITNTTGPINVVSVGAGFPLQAEMQRLEYLKHCDVMARNIQGELHDRIATLNSGKLRRILDVESVSSGWLAGAQTTMLRQRPLLRAAVADTLYDPPVASPLDDKSNRVLREHYELAIANADKRYVRGHELDTAPGEGRWETLKAEIADTTILYELMDALGNEERARSFISHVAGQLIDLTHSQLRPFSVSSLDWRSRDELRATAQLALDHPEIFDTSLVQRAAEF